MPGNSETSVEAKTSEADIYLIAGRLDVQERLVKIAAEIDAKNRKIARRMNDGALVYLLYAGLDGLNLSYTTYKYCVDAYLTNSKASSADTMHNCMMTPTGASIAVAESLTLIGFSILASYFSDDDPDEVKRYIAIVWPYCRDALKALKNTYKGTSNTIKMLDLLTGKNFNPFILPVALGLTLILIANRIWYRKMVSDRKAMMKKNMSLLAEILLAQSLTKDKIKDKRDSILYQDMSTRLMAFASAAISGSIDSLYLFMGILVLAPVAWPLFVTLSACCVLYTTVTMVTRIYDEYDFQRKLWISQARVELALLGKEQTEAIITQLHMLMQLQREFLQKDLDSEREIKRKYKELLALIRQQKGLLSEKRQEVIDLMSLSHVSAFLTGAKNGMAAYGALTSILFMASTILALSGTPLPPIFLISVAVIGLACLIGFITYTLIKNYYQRQEQKKQKDPFDKLLEVSNIDNILQDLEQLGMEEEATKVRETVQQGIHVPPPSRSFIVEWFEIVRSFFSGLGKGSKAVDFSLNSLQEADAKGHYHDTPVMLAITACSAFVCAVVWALRAHARGFGRPLLDDLPVKKVAPVCSPAGEPGLDDDQKPASPSPSLLSSLNNTASFFYKRNSNDNTQEGYELEEFVAHNDDECACTI